MPVTRRSQIRSGSLPAGSQAKTSPLPSVLQSSLEVWPIDWTGLPTQYMSHGNNDLEVLVALVRSVSPRHVIEFGVNVGRTAKAIMANVPGIERYTGIDVPLDYVPILALQLDNVVPNPGEMVLSDPRFHLIIRPRGSLDLTAADLEPCDVAFIDGDHGREAVLHDTMLARALVRPGGVIVWHDYHTIGNVDVMAVLDEMHHAGAAIQRIDNSWLAFERVA
jgi:predicted O-methyltransferase YrrM